MTQETATSTLTRRVCLSIEASITTQVKKAFQLVTTNMLEHTSGKVVLKQFGFYSLQTFSLYSEADRDTEKSHHLALARHPDISYGHTCQLMLDVGAQISIVAT